MRLPSKSGTFAILMMGSAVSALLVPSGWTAGLRGLFQPRALLQMPVSAAARETEQALNATLARPLSAREADRLRRGNEELRRQVVSQGRRLAEQQERLDDIAGLRGQSADNLSAIVLAAVASFDADPRRESLQVVLSARARPFVREGQWVAAGVRQDPSREMLAQQWLIGQVSEVHTRLARVQLITDPGFKLGVQTARVRADGTWQSDDKRCVLSGQGRGRMLIDQAEEDYFKSGYRIVMVPASRTLPFPLSLGRIDGSRVRDDSPQHVDLTVVPWQPIEELTHVYIIVTSTE